VSRLLALDLGTTGVRAVVYDEAARPLARAHLALRASYPEPGRVEQDPVELLERSCDVMRAALAEAGVGAADVAGLGLVTQRATALAWDARTGAPLAPAIGWQDQRTFGRVNKLRALGIPINTLASATKFEWCMQRVPEVQRAALEGRLCLGTPDAWLGFRLTGGAAHVSEPGNASCTALFSAHDGDWAQGLCDLFSVPREALPRVLPSSGVVGEVEPRWLGAGVALAARAGDQQAACFGQGVHRADLAKLTLGTSGMLDLHTGDVLREAPQGAYPLALWTLGAGERAFCLEGTVITAGSALEWLVDLGLAPDVPALLARAERAVPYGEVVFVPALQGLGTPHARDDARGLFVGLTRGSGTAELARAALEGIAQRCAEVAAALGVRGELRVDGGLARSDLLLQALADLSGLVLVRAQETETTALGAAQLAGLALGVFSSPAACRDALGPGRRFAPRAAERAERWRARFERALHRASGAADPSC
jgi:glycerol kinase